MKTPFLALSIGICGDLRHLFNVDVTVIPIFHFDPPPDRSTDRGVLHPASTLQWISRKAGKDDKIYHRAISAELEEAGNRFHKTSPN